jgi:hypothetical protein
MPASYTRPLSWRRVRCVSARVVEEWQLRLLRRHRRRQPRKGGTGNYFPTCVIIHLEQLLYVRLSVEKGGCLGAHRESGRMSGRPCGRSQKRATLSRLRIARYNSDVKRRSHPVCSVAFTCVRRCDIKISRPVVVRSPLHVRQQSTILPLTAQVRIAYGTTNRMYEGAVPVAARHRSAIAKRQSVVAARVNGSVTRSAQRLRGNQSNSQTSGNCEGEDPRVHRMTAC